MTSLIYHKKTIILILIIVVDMMLTFIISIILRQKMCQAFMLIKTLEIQLIFFFLSKSDLYPLIIFEAIENNILIIVLMDTDAHRILKICLEVLSVFSN